MKLKHGNHLAPALVFMASAIWVLPSFSQENKLKAPSIKVSSESKVSEFSGTVRAEGVNYLTKIKGDDEQNETYLLSTDLNYLYKSGLFVNRFEFSAGSYAGGGGSVLSFPELYTSIQTENSSYALGRKLEFWSTIDHEWNLGLWQGQFTIDALRPAEQGLTGLFYKIANDKFQFLAFATPVFIPSLGPNVKESNGGLKANRWFRSPSQSFQIAGQDTKLIYSINSEEAKDLISNPGGGMRMIFSEGSEGFWALGSYGYKPMNSLLVKYTRNTIQPGNGILFSQVELSPALAYHEVFGSDLGYNYKSGSIALSYLEDRPVGKLPLSTEFIQQVPSSLQAWSLNWSHEFSTRLKVTSGLLKIDGGRFEDYNSLGEPQGAVFNSRVLFRQAASIGFQTEAQFGQKKWINKGKFLRDLSQKGSLMTFESQFFPSEKVGIVGGVDVLGVDQESNSDAEIGFLNNYRANDRVFGGLSYVF